MGCCTHTDKYPLFTNYWCILITGVFRFLKMTVVCDIIIRNFPLNIVYNAFISLHQRKKTEMSFLRVSDLLLVCVVLNHDADALLYINKIIFLLKINEKLSLEKCVCLFCPEDFDSLIPCLKTENDVKPRLSTWVTLCPNMAERCRHKKVPPLFYLVCLRPFGAPSGRAYVQYRLCSLFMIMKHICDDISYHE